MSRPAPSNLLKSSPQKDKKAVHPDMLVKFPQHQGLPHPKTTFQEFVHQVLVRIHPIKLQNPKKREQKQIATIGKPQINQTKKGSSPYLFSLYRVFHPCKKYNKRMAAFHPTHCIKYLQMEAMAILIVGTMG